MTQVRQLFVYSSLIRLAGLLDAGQRNGPHKRCTTGPYTDRLIVVTFLLRFLPALPFVWPIILPQFGSPFV